MAITLFVSAIVLMALGFPVAFALAMSAAIAVFAGGRYPQLIVFKEMFTGIDSFPLMAVPFFILAAEIMSGGALTIVLPAQPSLTWDLGDTKGTVAVRMPDNTIARELLQETGPLAVSSANLTGEPAANTIDEAQNMLGDSVGAATVGSVAAGPTSWRALSFA